MAFVAAVTQVHPDLSEQDEDGDDPDNLWEEGLDDRATYGPVKELVVNDEITPEALQVLITAAVDQSLKLYDSEGEVVYP